MNLTTLKTVFSLLCVALVGLVLGDTIELGNGDRLTGTLQGVGGGLVSLETEYAGLIFIKQDQVAGIKTEDKVRVTFTDGKVSEIKLTEEINVSELVSVTAPGEGLSNFVASWKKRLTVSIDGSSGTSDTQNYSTFGESVLTRGKSEQILSLALIRENTESVTTKNTFDAKYNMRWLHTKDWYTTASLDYFQDSLRDIDGRSVFGLGGGRKLIDYSLTSLSVDLSASGVYEEVEAINELLAAIRFGSNYEKKLYAGKIEMFQSNRLLWLIEDNRWTLDGTVGLRFLFTKRLNIDFRSNVQFDGGGSVQPSATDITYSLGISTPF